MEQVHSVQVKSFELIARALQPVYNTSLGLVAPTAAAGAIASAAAAINHLYIEFKAVIYVPVLIIMLIYGWPSNTMPTHNARYIRPCKPFIMREEMQLD